MTNTETIASKRHCVSRGRRLSKNRNFNTGYKFCALSIVLQGRSFNIFEYSLVNIVDQCVHLARSRSIDRDCGSKERRGDRGFDVAHGSNSEMSAAICDVRLNLMNRHRRTLTSLPKSTTTGLMRRARSVGGIVMPPLQCRPHPSKTNSASSAGSSMCFPRG
jgi:hypothetical protein